MPTSKPSGYPLGHTLGEKHTRVSKCHELGLGIKPK